MYDIYYLLPYQLMLTAAMLKKDTAQCFRLANSARIFQFELVRLYNYILYSARASYIIIKVRTMKDIHYYDVHIKKEGWKLENISTTKQKCVEINEAERQYYSRFHWKADINNLEMLIN